MYAEERERQGSDLDDNAYTLMDLVDQLLEDLSSVDEDGFDQSADVLDNLANAINIGPVGSLTNSLFLGVFLPDRIVTVLVIIH